LGDGPARIECGWAGPACPGEPDALSPWLAAAEIERARGFGSAARHREHLLGRALARRLLHEHFGLDPRSVTLGADAHGRLGITSGGSGLWLGVSHSRGVVAAAATEAGPVGLDVERIREVPRAERIADRWFREGERRQLHTLEGAARARRFLELWTLKEAQLKATGQGLAGALGAFGFEVEADGRALPVAGGREEPRRWSFRSFGLGPDAVGAAALRAGGREIALSAAELHFPAGAPGCGPVEAPSAD
jgi:4'-phosphopantetheinyl transferase